MVSPQPCQCGQCDGCLLWTGGINKKTGYGHFSIGYKTYLAHRVAWELAEGQFLHENIDVDHVYEAGCRHHHCVKREHLEAVTIAVNNQRIVVTERTRQRRSAAGRKAWASDVPPDAAAEAQILELLIAEPGGKKLREITALTGERASVVRARLLSMIERGLVRSSKHGYRISGSKRKV
jgi:hypothetical protein